MTDPRVVSICDEFGITIIGRGRYPNPGETRAADTMHRIMKAYGEAHLRLVLTTLAETSNNKACIDKTSLWCISDLIRAFPHLVEHHTSAWLECFDAMPLGELMFLNNQCLRGHAHLRHSLSGMLTERIYRRFGPLSVQPDLFDDRRRVA